MRLCYDSVGFGFLCVSHVIHVLLAFYAWLPFPAGGSKGRGGMRVGRALDDV